MFANKSSSQFLASTRIARRIPNEHAEGGTLWNTFDVRNLRRLLNDHHDKLYNEEGADKDAKHFV